MSAVLAEPQRVEIPEALGFLFDPPLGSLRWRCAYGGRGSAKSWSFARALLVHGVARPLRVLCAREYQTSIRDSVHRLLSDQIVALNFSGCYTVQRDGIYGHNGTEFLFKGLRHNIREIKSTEGIDICWIEEAEAVSEQSWRTLTPTIRKARLAQSEIWVTFNPALPDDPTYVRLVEKPPADAIVRAIGYRDNPWLPDVLAAEAAHLKRTDPEAYAHVWGGEPWTRSDAQVLNGKWAVDTFAPKDHWDGPYFGADWGFAHDPTTLVKLWRADNRLYVEHEAGGVELDFDETEAAFRTVPGAKDHVIRADSARPETIHEMVRRGWQVVAAPKWDGSVADGIAHLRSYDQIVIHDRCTRTAREAKLWRYKTNDAEDVLPKLVDGNEHSWDAARYALAPLIKGRNRLISFTVD